MPKKQSFGTSQGISSRQVMIVLGVTLLLAVIIVVVFTFLVNRDADDNQDYQNYLNNLKQQANTPAKGNNEAKEQTTRQTVRGVLTEISTDLLAVAAEGSNEKIDFALRNDTVITYQNQAFDRSRFFVGDQLSITARQDGSGWTAETIIVLVSASPATPAPLPQITPQNIRPDGSIKPL